MYQLSIISLMVPTRYFTNQPAIMWVGTNGAQAYDGLMWPEATYFIFRHGMKFKSVFLIIILKKLSYI